MKVYEYLYVVIITLLTVTSAVLITSRLYNGKTAKEWYLQYAEIKVSQSAIKKCLFDAQVELDRTQQSTESIPCLNY